MIQSENVYGDERISMLHNQLRRRGIRDERVLRAMAKVPRHLFVPEPSRYLAYEDRALPIGHGQTVSQPYMVALMLEALDLDGDERVLEVGTGSGYQAAVLGEIAREVWSVEIVPELADSARKTLDQLGYTNVHVAVANGSVGLPGNAPYDAIVVAAGSPDVPYALVSQLKPDGRLVIPVGELGYQTLRRITRRGERAFSEDLLRCAFVPLLGEQGWTERGPHLHPSP